MLRVGFLFLLFNQKCAILDTDNSILRESGHTATAEVLPYDFILLPVLFCLALLSNHYFCYSRMEKNESSGDRPRLPTEPHAASTLEEGNIPRERKPFSFYMSILMLAMIGLIVSWDVTALSLALPVSRPRSRAPLAAN